MNKAGASLEMFPPLSYLFLFFGLLLFFPLVVFPLPLLALEKAFISVSTSLLRSTSKKILKNRKIILAFSFSMC